MLQPTSVKFLKDLENNNNKPWFEEHRTAYESTKADFETLVGKLIPAVAEFDEPLGTLQVKDCVFRINRDVRFSKNKTPYKNNMGADISLGGKKSSVAGYYFHFQPGNSFAGGGFYMPSPAELAKIRQELDYGFEEWKAILHNKNFVKYFPAGVSGMDTLVRPPKGYDENNPAINYLKMKSFFVTKPFTDEELQSKTLVNDIAKIFKIMKPLIDFLNRAVE